MGLYKLMGGKHCQESARFWEVILEGGLALSNW